MDVPAGVVADDPRVHVADLAQLLDAPVAGLLRRAICAQEREGNGRPELVPERLELHRAVDPSSVPEQGDQLAVDRRRDSGGGGRPHATPDDAVERLRVGRAAGRELLQQLVRIEALVGATRDRGVDVGARLAQPSLEGARVGIRGEDDGMSALRESACDVLRHPRDEILVACVEVHHVLLCSSVVQCDHRTPHRERTEA